jgi:hypothetical protein
MSSLPHIVSDPFPTLESYVDDTLQKIIDKDPSTTKLILDDFRFPNVDWDSDSSLDAPTMIRMMETATRAIISGNNDKPSPLQELELRFVDLSSQQVSQALLKLVSAKLEVGSCWNSISLVGCNATPEAWADILSPVMVQACDELVLNHNSLPLQAYMSLGQAMRTPAAVAKLSSLHIQRETIQGDKAQALFGDRHSNQNATPLLKLQELVLNFCRLDVPAVQILSRNYLRSNDQLQILNMGACYLADRQVFSVVNALGDKPSLHTLILTLNHCHKQGSLALQELLSSPHCQLQSLNLSHQKTRGQKQLHMAAVAQGVASCQSLRQLNLSRNLLNAKDVQMLLECLQESTCGSSLQSLDLMSNPLGRQGLATVAMNLPELRSLKRLNLTNTGHEEDRNKANDDNDEDVVSLEPISKELQDAMENLPLALIQGMQHNTSLENLEFCRMEWLSPKSESLRSSSSSSSLRSISCGQNNSSCRSFSDVHDLIQHRSEEQLLDLVNYYTVLNIGGRRLLSCSDVSSSRDVPLGVWPLALEKAQQKCLAARSDPLIPDALFHLLRQGPALMQQRKNNACIWSGQMLVG